MGGVVDRKGCGKGGGLVGLWDGLNIGMVCLVDVGGLVGGRGEE